MNDQTIQSHLDTHAQSASQIDRHLSKYDKMHSMTEQYTELGAALDGGTVEKKLERLKLALEQLSALQQLCEASWL